MVHSPASPDQTPVSNRFLDNLPSMKTVAHQAAKILLPQTYYAAKVISEIPTAASYLYNHSPLDTLAKGTTWSAFSKTTPFSLRSQDIISNMPTDTIKLSNEQKKIAKELLNPDPTNPLAKTLTPALKKDMEELLDRFSSSKWSNKIPPSYRQLSPGQKKALDVIKFQQLQGHFTDLQLHQKGSTSSLDKAELAYENAEIDYTESHTGELLAKSLAYLHPDVLEHMGPIFIPVRGELVPFKIDSHTMGTDENESKLPFITLTPDKPNVEPWLVIRGTNPNVIGKGLDSESKADAWESVMADFLNKEGMATAPIDNALEKFAEIANELNRKTGKPVNMAGHSLGGWGVQYLAVTLQTQKEKSDTMLTPELGNVYGYNSPGVSTETKRMYNALEEKPNLVNFNKVGDVVPNVGRRLIGTHFRVKGKDNIFHLAHRQIDSHGQHSLQKNDIEAEESKGARRLSEGARRHLAGSAARAGLKVAEKVGHSLAPWAEKRSESDAL